MPRIWLPEGVKRNRFHPDDRVRATLSTCGRGACTYLQQIPYNDALRAKADGKDCYEQALDFYDRAIGFNPGDAGLWARKGKILTQLKRRDEAEAAFQRIAEIDPDYRYQSGWSDNHWARQGVGKFFSPDLVEDKYWTSGLAVIGRAVVAAGASVIQDAQAFHRVTRRGKRLQQPCITERRAAGVRNSKLIFRRRIERCHIEAPEASMRVRLDPIRRLAVDGELWRKTERCFERCLDQKSLVACRGNQMRELALIPSVCLLRVPRDCGHPTIPRAAAPAPARMNSRRLSPLVRAESVS